MVDPLSKRDRSAFMARIGSKDTRPELVVRKLLHAMGYRYRLHHKGLPGRPDVAFTKRRKAIFVHGCFWHAHRGCAFAHAPKTHTEYWQAKLEGNCVRDKRNEQRLTALGWEVLTIWECELTSGDRLAPQLATFIGPPSYRSTKTWRSWHK